MTDGTTKKARTISTGKHVAWATERRLKIRLRSGQEAQDSESLEGCCLTVKVNCGSEIGQTQPLAEDDLLPDVNGGILDLRPNSQQGKGWNLNDPKDQCEILWLIRKKRPKLVIGYGKCILFSTVLYHQHNRRGAWFLHDLSGNASQLSLPCMIRLECRHDVFHALGNARDRRDGGRVSFLTNSPHIARRVEGSKSHENLDSEICEGLRQQVDDAGHTSAMMHMTSGTQVRPFDLTLPNTEEAQSEE